MVGQGGGSEEEAAVEGESHPGGGGLVPGWASSETRAGEVDEKCLDQSLTDNISAAIWLLALR